MRTEILIYNQNIHLTTNYARFTILYGPHDDFCKQVIDPDANTLDKFN